MRHSFLIIIATSLSLVADVASAIDYKFVQLVNQQTEVPGLPGTSFHTPRGGEISDDRVLITGYYSSDEGYFIQKNGMLETVVRNGQSFPGVSFDSHFDGATFTDSGVAFAYNQPGGGIFHKTTAGLSSIARIGDSRPEGVFERFGAFASDGDDIAFRGRVKTSWGGTLDGIYLSNAAGLTRIADSGSFNFNQTISLENGKVVFADGVPNSSKEAIYMSDGVTTTTILESGVSTSVGQLRGVSNPQLRNGKLSFFASWFSDQSGIFTWDNGNISSIVAKGDVAPTGKFDGFFLPAFNGDAIATRAIYTGGAGIFSNYGGKLHSVIQDGGELFGVELGSVYTGMRALSDDGKIVFFYNLANGEEGVALAIPVPEPKSLMLLAACVPFCRFIRGRNR